MKEKIPSSLIDSVKLKLIEVGADYFKKKFETSKKDIIKYIEKEIDKKIRKEVRKITVKIIFYILLSLGGIFLLFGIFSAVIYLLELPEFLTSILFGLFLILIGVFIWGFNWRIISKIKKKELIFLNINSYLNWNKSKKSSKLYTLFAEFFGIVWPCLFFTFIQKLFTFLASFIISFNFDLYNSSWNLFE